MGLGGFLLEIVMVCGGFFLILSCIYHDDIDVKGDFYDLHVFGKLPWYYWLYRDAVPFSRKNDNNVKFYFVGHFYI